MTTPTPSDTDLVARAKGGDAAAFEALVHHNTKLVLSLAVRLVGNREDAEELAQETFIRAYRAIGSFQGTARFSTWIYRIAVNLCLDFLRRAEVRREAHAAIAAVAADRRRRLWGAAPARPHDPTI